MSQHRDYWRCIMLYYAIYIMNNVQMIILICNAIITAYVFNRTLLVSVLWAIIS